MIHTLLSNRMEDLVDPLARLLAMPVSNPLTADVILVQHQGMQHWLSMALAQHPERQVAMNLDYPLPALAIWDLIRRILGPDQVPEQSLYQREVMVWRLFELLAEPEVTGDPAFAEPNRYWQNQSSRQQVLRRFELAEQVADLFEQYLIYRPDWIQSWDQGRNQSQKNGEQDHWQARLWRHLTAGEPGHPVRLMEQALSRMDRPSRALPERLFLFGINALAPLWLDFIRALSQRGGVDFHILCLNPSDEYWGDLVSEKRAARQRALWLTQHDSEDGLIQDLGNPLIASLGQQGQTFVHQLMERSDLETPLFSRPRGTHDEETRLHRLQKEILSLTDGREQPTPEWDDAIHLVSAHSPLREVQGLHDWLLHQFNNDPTLTPKDVLVMCPNVEDYAPFVEAVFARRFDELGEDVPPLPCSIADRALGDSDPTVAAFLELLSLPDARFQVNQVMGWLQVPAIRARLALSGDDIEQIAQWLQVACVHWGLDQPHKGEWTGEGSNDRYTWAQGLERLLLGFAWGDEEAIVEERLLLPQVEGSQALILGKLLAFVQELRSLSRDLRQPRTVADWQGFLHQRLRQALFSADNEYEPAHDDLRQCIRDLSDQAHRAGLKETLPLTVVRHVLEQSLSSPQRTGRQFLTGQITVCSMIPMRSIPFRVIAVLGLNDGDFPRQRPPLGFDLMASDPPRPGDRSRRGDDRYLFLEALLSARDRLYLSYQGRDVRSNTEQPPSLVLSELMHYLDGSSGWDTGAIRQLPLQPFSWHNYQGDWPGFDGQWLRLSRPHAPREKVTRLPEPEWPESLTLEQLVTALDHPARHFARERLRLFLDQTGQTALADSEPFAANHLDRYKLQQSVIEGRLKGEPERAEKARRRYELSGESPDHALMEEQVTDWQQQAEQFAGHLSQQGADRTGPVTVAVTLEGLTLEGELPLTEQGTLVLWRLANAKSRDRLRLGLSHLLANCQQATGSLGLFRGKEGEVESLTMEAMPAEEAREQLGQWLALWRQSLMEPLPYHGELGFKMSSEKFKLHQFYGLWQGDDFKSGLSDDPYLAWFWPQPPDPQDLMDPLLALYGPLQAMMQSESTPLSPATPEEADHD
ncbi:MAG: exodeoxyribonuclease V subunit gamma [Oleiphilaceae bacterium]|nr:exodeoxyribonuclease V subunit gamma [Oleiphilaceae bacterium]